MDDYRIVVRAWDTRDGIHESYVLLDSFGNQVDAVAGRDAYDRIYRKAVFLQECLTSRRAPDRYMKVPLIGLGRLTLYRTVTSGDGGMRWVYVAEDGDGRAVAEGPSFLGTCRTAAAMAREGCRWQSRRPASSRTTASRRCPRPRRSGSAPI